MQDTNVVCPYCKNTGQIAFKEEKTYILDRNGNKIYDDRYYTCFCVNNRIISKQFNQLTGVPDITPQEALFSAQFAGFKNFLIFGNEMKFWHLVKATMLLHANFHRTFEILNGYDVIKRYYVEQPDGVVRSIDDLEDRDLLVFVFDASMENKAQNKVVFEVIKRRVRMNNPDDIKENKKIYRPTWIYAPTKEGFKDSKEYSSDIEELIADFGTLNLNKYPTPFSVKERKSSKKIAGLNQDLGTL